MRKVLRLFVVLIGLAALNGLHSVAQAQPDFSSVRPEDLVSPELLPERGTYWLVLSNSLAMPYPFFAPILRSVEAPVYAMTNGSFLVDGTSIDLAAYREQMAAERALTTLEREYGLSTPTPPGEGGEDPGPSPQDAYAYGSNTLWLEIIRVTNGIISLTVHGTVEDQTYELLSRERLSDTNWASEGTILGAPDQDWTPATVAVGTRTNSLFFWARSWADEDGDGLPSWWEMANGLDPNSADTGNTGIPDGYKNPRGDGWNNLYKWEHGMSIGQFYQPPPPRNFTAQILPGGTNVVLTWESGGGPVVAYAIERIGDSSVTNFVGSNTLTFTDSSYFHYGDFDVEPSYEGRAYFPDGSSSGTGRIKATKQELDSTVQIFQGPGGTFYLAVQAPPANLAKIRLFSESTTSQILDLDATNLVNGIAPLPNFVGNEHLIDVRCLDTNGKPGPKSTVVVTRPEEEIIGRTTNFINAAALLKENLKFLLRSATRTLPFSFLSDVPTSTGSGSYSIDNPEHWYVRRASPTNYEYSGFHVFSGAQGYSVMHEVRPVAENFLWRNFVYSAADADPTGVDLDYDPFTGTWIRTLSNPLFEYSGSGTETPLPIALTNAAFRWSWHGAFESSDSYALAEAGVYTNSSGNIVLPNNAYNCYGLQIKSVLVDSSDILTAGGTGIIDPLFASYYTEADSPHLQTVGYFFTSQTPYFNYYGAPPPLPGSPDFTVNTPSQVLIAPFARPLTVAGWAKQWITNSVYPNKYAYLEQYWDKACKTDTNGVATTNQTGLLSPYGEFFATEPGRIALTTLSDAGERGTGIVNVIKLQLDVNHDGVMDLSFGGPDNTSPAKPFVFWINNDNDGAGVGKEVDVEGRDDKGDYQFNSIRSQRGLEDYARLWICGLPALPSVQDYTVHISCAAISGSPSIKLYPAYESNGGSLYLSDTNVAKSTVTNGYFSSSLGAVSVGHDFQFPSDFFAGTNRYLLFEGAGVGQGEFTLTVQKGSNVVAQTSTWLDLRDVRELYEQVVITNLAVGLVTNWHSGVFKLVPPTANALGDDTNIMIYAHGNDNGETDWLEASATIFKRLYWTGFRGKFCSVHWPSPRLLTLGNFSTSWLNKSEVIGYQSGVALKSYATQLQSRFSGFRLHLWAHSGGGAMSAEALRLGASFDTLILSSISLSTSCFDVNAALNPILVSADAGTPTPEWQPMGYRTAYTNLTARVFNYFNTNDDLLISTFGWFGVQRYLKPDVDYFYDGTNSFYTLLNDQEMLITDTQESRAMVSRSRTAAIGAQGPASGQTRQGVIQSAVDLHAQFGLGNSQDDHGGFFIRPYQTIQPYYFQVLTDCGIPHSLPQ